MLNNIPVIDLSENSHHSDIERKRCIDDILTVYNSDRFTNVKNNILRTIDLLYDLGYYKYSESLFLTKE